MLILSIIGILVLFLQVMAFLDAGDLKFETAIHTCVLNNIRKELQRNMSSITDLQSKFDATVVVVKTAFTDVAARLDANAAQITALQAQIAAGATVDPAELAAISADISAQSDALTAGAAALEAKLTPPVA